MASATSNVPMSELHYNPLPKKKWQAKEGRHDATNECNDE